MMMDLTNKQYLQFIFEWKERQQRKETDSLDVLVIDTLHTASVSADENSAQDMGMVLKACRLAMNSLVALSFWFTIPIKGDFRKREQRTPWCYGFMIKLNVRKRIGTNARMFCSKLKDGEQWRDQDFHLSIIEVVAVFMSYGMKPNEAEKSFMEGKTQTKTES